MGGEVPGAWVFVAEHVKKEYVSFACAVLTAGLTGGIFLGALVATGTHYWFTTSEILAGAWRWPFLLGGAFGFLALFLRRYLAETPVFQAIQAELRSTEIPLWIVLKQHRPAMLLTGMLSWILAASIVTMILMTPALLQSVFRITAQRALEANMFATFCLSLGCITFGALAGKWGVGRILLLGSSGLAASSLYLYSAVATSDQYLLPLYGLNGFFVGIIALVPAVGVSAFPPKVRFTGLSFSYNIAYAIFGGLTPIFISLVIPLNSMAPAYYVATLASALFMIGIYLIKRSPQQPI